MSCCPAKASASDVKGHTSAWVSLVSLGKLRDASVSTGYATEQVGVAVSIPTPRVDVGSGGHQRISFSPALGRRQVDPRLVGWRLVEAKSPESTGKLDRVAGERTTLLSPGICRPTCGEGQQQDGWHSRSSFRASWRSPSRVDSTVASRCQEAPRRTRRHAAVRVVPSQRLLRWPTPRLATEVLFMLVYSPLAHDLPSEVANTCFACYHRLHVLKVFLNVIFQEASCVFLYEGMQAGRADSRCQSGRGYFRDGLVFLIPLRMSRQDVNFAGTVGAAGYHVATWITLRSDKLATRPRGVMGTTKFEVCRSHGAIESARGVSSSGWPVGVCLLDTSEA